MNLKNIKNLIELFFNSYELRKKDDFLISLNPFKKYSWIQTYNYIQKLFNEINKYIQPKDRCLLISENRPEWLISDLAIMLAGGITVPAYITYTEKDYDFIINDCKPSIIIVSGKSLFLKVKNSIIKNKFIKTVISFESFQDDEVEIKNIEKIFEEKKYLEKHLSKVNLVRSDIACIIYTSGTQGNPKGVMLSHGGILNNCEGSAGLLSEIINDKPKFLTWLPLSHSYKLNCMFVRMRQR